MTPQDIKAEAERIWNAKGVAFPDQICAHTFAPPHPQARWNAVQQAFWVSWGGDKVRYVGRAQKRREARLALYTPKLREQRLAEMRERGTLHSL